MEDRGLGDTVERVIKATAIDRVAERLRKRFEELGYVEPKKDDDEDCLPCQKRKEKLNKLFPY